MALIPGTLPSDTCYGTPQDLLELFAQYLDIPAFALNNKVVFSTTNPGASANDIIWFDTNTPTNPILKVTVSGTFTDYIKNYVNQATTKTIAGNDYLLVSDSSASGAMKKGLVSGISVTYPMLSDSATEADNVAKRTAKAWVMFNGATLTAYSTQSFNISSIARIAGATTGGFRVSFTTAMQAANYSVLGAVGYGDEVWNNVVAASVRIIVATTGYVDFVTVRQGANSIDFPYTSIAVLSS